MSGFFAVKINCSPNVYPYLFFVRNRMALTLLIVCSLLSGFTRAQTAGVGAGQTYLTLNDAFTAINNGVLTGSIKLEIRSNITISATATLNASGTGSANYSTLSIYPTANYAITANVDGPAIDLAGADRVTMDGRINGANPGTPYSLTLENTNTGSNACLIHVRDGGNTNDVQHVVLKGAGGSATRGMFTVDGTGNSTNNIVQYCRVTNSNGNRPNSVFYINTTGSSSAAIFFGNEVFDIFRAGGDSKAVVITGTHLMAFVMNNHFYETVPINVTGAYTYRAVSIEGSAVTGVSVQGNNIGGSQINAGGTPMTFTSSFAPQFDAIYVAGGSAANPASVQGNTITNISFQSSKNNINNIYSPGFFNAIYATGTNTYANIGDVSGNTIGSQSATGAIQLYPTNSSLYCPAVMIFTNATGTVNIQNNTIGGISSTGAALAKSLVGILNAAPAGTYLISGNTIGSPATANSIEVGANSLNTSVNELVWGIASLNTSGDFTITNNTVANITQQATGPNASALKHLAGIFLLNGGNMLVNNNHLHHLTSYSNMSIGAEFSSVVGISVFQNTGTIGSVSGNSIYELLSANTGNLTTEVTGIAFKGNTGNAKLRNNYINNLRLSASSNSAKMTGIHIGASGGTATLFNNVIALGTGISNGYIIYGIQDGSQLAGNTHQFYFNTIYLSGNPGGGSNTAALYLGDATPSGREIINNILVNERTNSAGTAKHYGLFVTGTPTLTANYNDYYTPGTGGIPGFFSTDQNALPVITGQDAASLSQSPGFTVPGGSAATDYIPTLALPGTAISGYENDYQGITRPGSPYMGAFHYSDALPVTWVNFTAQRQGDKVLLNWATASEQSGKDFVIQHRGSAGSWLDIGIIAAIGNSNLTNHYQYIHASPANGNNYYRILQRDVDGRYTYSTVRKVEIAAAKTLQLLGNPVVGGVLTFNVSQPIELSLLSANGSLIWKKRFTAGYHQENIGQLTPGVYYLRSGNEVIAVVK